MWTIIEGEDVRINPDAIPEHVMEYFAKDTLAAARRFYADPKNREAFNQWKAARDGNPLKNEKVPNKVGNPQKEGNAIAD